MGVETSRNSTTSGHLRVKAHASHQSRMQARTQLPPLGPRDQKHKDRAWELPLGPCNLRQKPKRKA